MDVSANQHARGRGQRFWALVSAVAVLASLPAVSSALSPAATAYGPESTPCVTAKDTYVVGAAGQPVTLSSGQDTFVALPSDLVGAVAVMLQTTAGPAIADAALSTRRPADSDVDRQPLLTVRALDSAASSRLVRVQDGQFVVHAEGAALDVTIRVVAAVNLVDCFTAAEGAAILGGSPDPTGISPGSPQAVALLDFLPAPTLTAVISAHIVGGPLPSTVTATTDDGSVIGTYPIAAGETVDVTQLVPPTATGVVSIAASGAPVTAVVRSFGWFTDATSMLFDTKELAAKSAVQQVLAPVTSFPLPDRGQDAATALLSVRVGSTAGIGGSLTIWAAGLDKPAAPTVSSPSLLHATQQLVAVSPGDTGALSVDASPGTEWSVSLVGWSSKPPVVNAPADNTEVAASGELAVLQPPATPDDPQVLRYTGAARLAVGDVLAGDDSPDLPEGMLGFVTRVYDEFSGEPSAPGNQIVETQPASLMEAIPTGEFSEEVASNTDAPEALGADQTLPPDDPPGSTTIASTTNPQSRSVASVAASGLSGALPKGSTFSCSGGVSAGLEASLQMTGGLRFGASWVWPNKPTADFGFDGHVIGSARAYVKGSASCNAVIPMNGPTLPSLRFTLGVVPVWVTPKISATARVSGSIDGSAQVSAGFDAGISTGIRYANGGFSGYANPSFNSNGPRVDTHVSASLNADYVPRVTFYFWGVVGPYVEVGPFAEARAASNQSPWWYLDGGIKGGIGVSTTGWLNKGSWSLGTKELYRRRLGQASVSWPGTNITATSVTSGQVGSNYDQLIGSVGGTQPARWYQVGGTMPPGLSVRSDGHVVGTPTQTGSWNFVVRTIDANGYRSVSDRPVGISIGAVPPTTTTTTAPPTTTTTTPPPGATVTVSKGAQKTVTGCTTSSCRWVTVTVANMGAPYRVSCYSDLSSSAWYSYTTSSTTSNVCVYGYTGHRVWAVVNGVTSNQVVW